MWDLGGAYELRTLELPIGEPDSSSLLPTPLTVPDSEASHNQLSGTFRAAMDKALALLPTPTVSETTGAGNTGRAGGLNLRTVVDLLPTPRATRGGGHTETMQLLPTPTAANPNDGEDLESWESRRQANLAKGVNGNGQGTPLGVAVRLIGALTGTLFDDGSESPDEPLQPQQSAIEPEGSDSVLASLSG